MKKNWEIPDSPRHFDQLHHEPVSLRQHRQVPTEWQQLLHLCSDNIFVIFSSFSDITRLDWRKKGHWSVQVVNRAGNMIDQYEASAKGDGKIDPFTSVHQHRSLRCIWDGLVMRCF